MSATSPDDSMRRFRAYVVWVGLALVLFAFVGAWRVVRRLDALERTLTVQPPAMNQWEHHRDGTLTLALGERWYVPSRGVARVRVCGTTAPSAMRFEALAVTAAAPVVTSRTLIARHGSAQPCVEATSTFAQGRTLRLRLSARASIAPAPGEVSVRVGASIATRDMWPAMVLTLGIALLIVTRRRQGDEPTDYDPLPWVMRGPRGLVVALVVLITTNLIAVAPITRWGMRGASLLASTTLQHLLLLTLCVAALGITTASDRRKALELSAPPSGWQAQALATAIALLALATAIGTQIKDAADSPMGQLIEAAPTRYAVAFGALCAPLPEELFFRGLLGRLFEQLGNRRDAVMAIVAPAIIFAAMHALQLKGSLLGLVPITALALANGWLRWRSRSLVAPWAVHTIYNGVLALAALA